MNPVNELADCPNKPNCVCTKASREGQQMPPLRILGAPGTALTEVARVLQSLPRVQVLEQKEDYLHCTFRSLLFRFVDDVEFLVNAEERLLHFRSASRLGYSDLGANRRRMETVCRLLSELPDFEAID